MKTCLGLAFVAALSLASSAMAQSYHRTVLQQQDFPGATYRTVTAKTVVDPGGEVAKHTHPGAEMGYVVAGQGTVTISTAAPRPLAAGDSFAVPEGVVHSVRNTGSGPLTLLSTYVVDKSKPIATPAP
jgi:quercetin dioxygenase-like cupin family protein